MSALLLGFLFAFWAMEIDQASEVMLFNVATLLLTGEHFFGGEDLAEMGTSPRAFQILLTLLALFLFLACALNIFIAVLGDCYDLEQERMVSSFQAERARICSS